MTGANRLDDVTAYAAAVRAALADLPAAARADLQDDLESHLAEVAAESDAPLRERLGPPEAYAADLRAAYGVQTGTKGITEVAGGRRRWRSPRWRIAGAVAVTLAAAGILLPLVLAIATPPAPPAPERGDRWSYEQLVAEARAGHVRTMDIVGRTAVATDRTGLWHDVAVPGSTEPLAAEMTRDGVDTTYRQATSAQYWFTVLLPNLGLLVLVAGFGVALVLVIRRAPARPRAGWR
jgi:hypothetical protein